MEWICLLKCHLVNVLSQSHDFALHSETNCAWGKEWPEKDEESESTKEDDTPKKQRFVSLGLLMDQSLICSTVLRSLELHNVVNCMDQS